MLPKFAPALLRLRLALTQFSVGTLLAGALLLGAALLWLVILPGISTRVDEDVRAVARARSAPLPKAVVPAQALAAERLAAFYAALGDAGHTEQVVTQLFDAAAKAGVELEKAEYKPAHDAAGRFETYTIILPVKGDYARLRRFCETFLLTVPYAALDNMRFKRNSANEQAIEASLQFTVFLRPDVAGAVPLSAAASTSVAIPASASVAPDVAADRAQR
ncbi:hypothetical protein R69608_07515 [Paraburkholderia nemoris]|uniref:Pilus assembly protein PilO n=1 Tax=Paraburkholderia nemoris TaxID=2793076 RepID=A0ABN7N6K1_9BURK|nr:MULTISPECIES: hypothetical protein [Paraburkholderia]CAE6856969.1 hypothetical protein R69776_07792 [Paraburkholderia nemoris]CAE6971219.1 hypothetical protein R69608_07515 [Paraburkholderia nemoris]